MIAEGGTEHFHAVTIARSKEVMGEYTGYDGNPIMTHRHLGMQAEIANTGHADIVQLQDGSWYMVMLASRPYGGYHKTWDGETFIAPMIWGKRLACGMSGTGKLDGPILRRICRSRPRKQPGVWMILMGISWDFRGIIWGPHRKACSGWRMAL